MRLSYRRFIVAALLTLFAHLFSSALPAAAQFVPIPNAEFSEASDKDTPAHWTLSGGQGRWVDLDRLEVTGNGEDSNYWRCDYRFTPGALYRFYAFGRGTPTQGSAIVGPAFANRDYQAPSTDWTQIDYVFRVPENLTDSYFRLGQWHANGAIQFQRVWMTPSIAIHKSLGGLLLGDGETIEDGRYVFSGTFGHQGSNYHRTLESTTTGFNSDRWTFGNGSQVTYRFELPGHQLTSGEVSFNVNYHTGGGCAAEISRDGKLWRPLTTQDKLGTARAKVPNDLHPAAALFLRLKASPQNSSFQINRIEFSGRLSGAPPDAVGETIFADIQEYRQGMEIEEFTIQPGSTDGLKLLRILAKNTSRKTVKAGLDVTTAMKDVFVRGPSRQRAVIEAGESHAFTIGLPAERPGKHVVKFDLAGSEQGDGFIGGGFAFIVPEFYRADYGRRIDGSTGNTAVWWCNATHKIAPQRAAPKASSPAAELAAAKNDFEAVQVVVRPEEPLEGLTATAGKLVGPDGATIPAGNIKILRVAYHFVHHPTDKTGVRDFWPDALPPLAKPIDVPAGKNQPLWVLVHVPGDARAGDYSGKISLKAEGFTADVPLKLHVWDFALPETNHLETAFGFSAGNVFRYHGLKTEEDKRRVLDMYLQCYSEHRISPYNPAPMDSIGVRFVPEADPPRAELDFSRFDPAMARAVDKFHFTGIRLPIQGMGGGTFHSRSEPRIGKFGEDTPQYQAMFSSYVKQLEEHFREKGWLKHAYIYWFDEPAPKDYDFVADGFRRLKKHAPGLQRMLTEEPGDNVLTGPVDIWCPVSPNYHHEKAEARRAHGERFWWYVCTGPKAPYCTLFIDHPATELRVWLWQTWQRKISGILVWQSNYWTSSAAFPDQPQNPYEDPMGYVSGYSTPRGTKRYWGNGDGRFIYPAEAAAVPGHSGPDPVIAPPVSSIRWEMLREGVEDWEMLYLLRDLLAKRRGDLSPEQIKKYEALLEVPESITKDMTTFTADPTPIYTRRAEVAEAIERLAR